MTQLKGGPRKTFENFWNAVYEVSLKVTGLVLAFAPLGVGMLVAATVSENYAKLAPDDRFGEFLGGIVTFTLIVLAALAIHLLIVLPLIMRFIARVRPSRHFRAMSPALMTAFSTASSSATLPVTMECVEERAGVSNRTTSFVLPLGATVNMDGTALYECAAAMFVCQAMGFSLALPQQFFVVLVALLTSIGVAGVPCASLVAIVIILQSLERQLGVTGLVAALPILLVFDRLLDMCRTAVNIFSDSVGAVTIAKSEGETGVLEG
jgi:Na+/H+-dicarboxylate symporter